MCLGYADVVPYCLAKIVQMSGMTARKALGFTCLTPECRLILWKDSANERMTSRKALGFTCLVPESCHIDLMDAAQCRFAVRGARGLLCRGRYVASGKTV